MQKGRSRWRAAGPEYFELNSKLNWNFFVNLFASITNLDEFSLWLFQHQLFVVLAGLLSLPGRLPALTFFFRGGYRRVVLFRPYPGSVLRVHVE